MTIETFCNCSIFLINFLILFVSLDFWLGGRDDEVEGSWKWSSGTPFTYTHWLPGEPNDNSGVYKQDYLMTNYAGWIDHPSSLLHVRHYVCEMGKLILKPFIGYCILTGIK